MPLDDGHCIGCGADSPIGLHMHFEILEDGSVESRLTVAPPYQGWRNVVHGGIVALLLDEAMAYAAAARGVIGVTGDLKMRFRHAVPVGEPLVVRANVAWQRRNVLGVDATVSTAGELLLASGSGSFVERAKLRPGQRLGAGASFDGGR